MTLCVIGHSLSIAEFRRFAHHSLVPILYPVPFTGTHLGYLPGLLVILPARSDSSPYEKRMDAKGCVLGEKRIADEVPFEELPKGWAWARLSSLFTKIGSGSTPAGGRKVYQDEGPMLIRSQNVHNDGLRLDDVAHFSRLLFESRNSHVLPNDVLLNITGASIGRCAIVPDAFGNADVNQHVLIMRPVNDAVNEYLHVAIISPVVQIAIMTDQVGATKEGLSAAKAANLLVPIPPLAEQRRIVERMGELMPLVEEYGRLEDAREALDAALPSRLRKSVLQMAVQGNLVPQDPADEPASALLDRIRKQRRQLIAEKKMKAPKGGESVIFVGSDGRRYEKRIDAKGRESEPACIEGEIPFEIPDSWEWARLESLISLLSGTDLKPGQYNDQHEGIPYLTGASNFSDGALVENRWTSEATRVSRKGELLFTCKGTVGEMAVNSFEKAHIARQIMAIAPSDEDSLPYLTIYLKSMVESIRSSAKGVIPGIERNTLLNALIPVPPTPEQARISKIIASLSKVIS